MWNSAILLSTGLIYLAFLYYLHIPPFNTIALISQDSHYTPISYAFKYQNVSFLVSVNRYKWLNVSPNFSMFIAIQNCWIRQQLTIGIKHTNLSTDLRNFKHVCSNILSHWCNTDRLNFSLVLDFKHVLCPLFQLQGAWPVDASCDHGHADFLRLGIRLGEERGRHEVHFHATGKSSSGLK